jgi:hypothetical protein
VNHRRDSPGIDKFLGGILDGRPKACPSIESNQGTP